MIFIINNINLNLNIIAIQSILVVKIKAQNFHSSEFWNAKLKVDTILFIVANQVYVKSIMVIGVTASYRI
jgi:hypothetical protein